VATRQHVPILREDFLFNQSEDCPQHVHKGFKSPLDIAVNSTSRATVQPSNGAKMLVPVQTPFMFGSSSPHTSTSPVRLAKQPNPANRASAEPSQQFPGDCDDTQHGALMGTSEKGSGQCILPPVLLRRHNTDLAIPRP